MVPWKPPATPFEYRVHEVVRSVPRGRVATYGDVAWMAGRPRAARAVGNIMAATPDGFGTPCHRIVRADGHAGGFGRTDAANRRKVAMLRAEGVVVGRMGKIRDFERVRWRGA